jgi:signal transduction histidine kinase
LESRVSIRWDRHTTVELLADPDQLEQLLINLVRNATEATLEVSSPGSGLNPSAGDIEVQVHRLANEVEILIIDSGPGLANPSNLFVPFFTTKPHGSGIGLTLSRQIAENHGGSLQLENRVQLPGCIARVRLPNT